MWTQNPIFEKDGLETDLSHISRMLKKIFFLVYRLEVKESIIQAQFFKIPLSNLFTTAASHKLQESQR